MRANKTVDIDGMLSFETRCERIISRNIFKKGLQYSEVCTDCCEWREM